MEVTPEEIKEAEVVILDDEDLAHSGHQAGPSALAAVHDEGVWSGSSSSSSVATTASMAVSNVIVDDSPLHDQMERNKECKYQLIDAVFTFHSGHSFTLCDSTLERSWRTPTMATAGHAQRHVIMNERENASNFPSWTGPCWLA